MQPLTLGLPQGPGTPALGVLQGARVLGELVCFLLELTEEPGSP